LECPFIATDVRISFAHAVTWEYTIQGCKMPKLIQATMVPEAVMPIEMHHVHKMPEKALLPKLN
jgi:hypothetical protein